MPDSSSQNSATIQRIVFFTFLASATFNLVLQFSGLNYSTTCPFPALDSATMYFFSQLSGLSDNILCFSAFWTLQLCTLFLSFLDYATLYFVSQLSGLRNNVLCFPAFWTLRRWCERRRWTWWASSFCTSRSSSTSTTICSYPGSWLVTFQNFYELPIPPEVKCWNIMAMPLNQGCGSAFISSGSGSSILG
jgi:hypothetical protein